MDFKESAYQILLKRGEPLSAKEITNIALKEGLIKSSGKTPVATMAAIIYMDIKKKAEKSKFVKIKKGLFGLKEWKERTYEPKDKSVACYEVQDIIINLKEKQFKSDSPTEFETVIRDAFDFLGFEAELIGGKGDTDVLLTANIGSESFIVNADGKTSKKEKIIDRQIDWHSLRDHKNKNKADYVVVVGHDFAGGNLEDRANEYQVVLLKTEELIKLIDAHSKFPFSLIELKDLFCIKRDRTSKLDDLLDKNKSKRNLLEQFKTIIKEMQSLQDRLGYFNCDTLSAREKIEELGITFLDINNMIALLKLPFIDGITEMSENKYILTLKTNDIANIFHRLANILKLDHEKREEAPSSFIPEIEKSISVTKDKGSKYFKWHKIDKSIIASARKEKPYEHYCPMEHFITILNSIIKIFKRHNIINTDLIFEELKGKNLVSNRKFKGKAEEYKIRMVLGILEIENLIKWTGSKRPIEYKLIDSIEKINNWAFQKFGIKY
ncbi:MAG: hypothetical protein A2Y62_09360 [Candidatus Fischerbacteria bacterium RBG_13_37_8]|uniref:HTH HARE-type domain-containing protein n=1 Tax=Candidatus Fischerbacteria bacterium RBG_13_37_8 TaxID=1817863 RepID=A0A1F5VL72_9BACT|nr:MAG: hypothetical protein A2Y62_09360 [Candidatus Fischerbacteria bacterium RBG_13_37_8]